MNIVPLSNNRIAITAHDDGKTALFTCRWKDGDVRPDELDRIGHDAMVEHAILNAYGHALYSGHDCCSEIETICDRIMKGIS